MISWKAFQHEQIIIKEVIGPLTFLTYKIYIYSLYIDKIIIKKTEIEIFF